MHLGILKKDMSPCSFPIILIARKNSGLKRIITDFKFLNSRLQRVNLSFPLLRMHVQFWEVPNVNAYQS